jgi:hypothetical protein
MAKNPELKEIVRTYAVLNPGLTRGRIAARLQQAGAPYGKQHLQNIVSELVNTGDLKEQTDQNGRRCVYPAPAPGAPGDQ